jgi:hypothetical protein
MKILLTNTMHDGRELVMVDKADLVALQAQLINAVSLADEMKEYIPLDILEKRQIERRIEDLQRVVETNKTE